jgi:hypothetical protein
MTQAPTLPHLTGNGEIGTTCEPRRQPGPAARGVDGAGRSAGAATGRRAVRCMSADADLRPWVSQAALGEAERISDLTASPGRSP